MTTVKGQSFRGIRSRIHSRGSLKGVFSLVQSMFAFFYCWRSVHETCVSFLPDLSLCVFLLVLLLLFLYYYILWVSSFFLIFSLCFPFISFLTFSLLFFLIFVEKKERPSDVLFSRSLLFLTCRPHLDFLNKYSIQHVIYILSAAVALSFNTSSCLQNLMIMLMRIGWVFQWILIEISSLDQLLFRRRFRWSWMSSSLSIQDKYHEDKVDTDILWYLYCYQTRYHELNEISLLVVSWGSWLTVISLLVILVLLIQRRHDIPDKMPLSLQNNAW